MHPTTVKCFNRKNKIHPAHSFHSLKFNRPEQLDQTSSLAHPIPRLQRNYPLATGYEKKKTIRSPLQSSLRFLFAGKRERRSGKVSPSAQMPHACPLLSHMRFSGHKHVRTGPVVMLRRSSCQEAQEHEWAMTEPSRCTESVNGTPVPGPPHRNTPAARWLRRPGPRRLPLLRRHHGHHRGPLHRRQHPVRSALLPRRH